MDFEIKIIEFLQSNTTTGWITFFKIITMFGSYLGFIITFLLLYRKNKRLSYFFIIVFLSASLFNSILKQIIARERPFVVNEKILNLDNESGFSMPSGHSMCAGLFATFLIYIILKSNSKKLTKFLEIFAIFVFVGMILLSRMVLGVHFLTDTLLGIFVGIMFAIFSIMLYNKMVKKIIQKHIELGE